MFPSPGYGVPPGIKDARSRLTPLELDMIFPYKIQYEGLKTQRFHFVTRSMFTTHLVWEFIPGAGVSENTASRVSFAASRTLYVKEEDSRRQRNASCSLTLAYRRLLL